MLTETAELAPEELDTKRATAPIRFASHVRPKWNCTGVSVGKPIGKEGNGVCSCGVAFLVEEASLSLVP